MKLALPEYKRYCLESWGAPTDDEPLIAYDKSPPVKIRVVCFCSKFANGSVKKQKCV